MHRQNELSHSDTGSTHQVAVALRSQCNIWGCSYWPRSERLRYPRPPSDHI